MDREPRILPECYADTLLIRIALAVKANHQSNISNVAKALKTNYKNRLAIGIVDNDKTQSAYFKEFDKIKEKDGLILKKHPNKKHYLIYLNPAFEQWVFDAAEVLGVEPAKYKIRNIKYFKKVSKDINVENNQQVKNFLNTIKQKKNSPVTTLVNWINAILKD